MITVQHMEAIFLACVLQNPEMQSLLEGSCGNLTETCSGSWRVRGELRKLIAQLDINIRALLALMSAANTHRGQQGDPDFTTREQAAAQTEAHAHVNHKHA